MIERLWRGWTAPEDADAYERLLVEKLLPRFADDAGEEFMGHRVLRRELDGETEFLTALRFDSLAAVRAFAGEEYERAHVPEEARELLARWDAEARHYEVRASDAPRRT